MTERWKEQAIKWRDRAREERDKRRALERDVDDLKTQLAKAERQLRRASLTTEKSQALQKQVREVLMEALEEVEAV
ncbi:hypothetical protein [Kistimonas asteriae]|uniref:hypothetical protein n=1 Tax=Kistimonas asteriae TaxID=517724 RepID=UPI001BA72869|nr:hypothetical protein [Kistimonas asteriae]